MDLNSILQKYKNMCGNNFIALRDQEIRVICVYQLPSLMFSEVLLYNCDLKGNPRTNLVSVCFLLPLQSS